MMYSWAVGELRIDPPLAPATLADLRALCASRVPDRLPRVFSHYFYFWPRDAATLCPLDALIVQGTVYAEHYARALPEIAAYLGRRGHALAGALLVVGEARRPRVRAIHVAGALTQEEWSSMPPGEIRRRSEAFAASAAGRDLHAAYYRAAETGDA